jgi:hypothetical protein
MRRMSRITESDVNRIVRKVIKEENERNESLMQKLMRKLKGVSDKQLEYNMKNDLPWDWKGSKEGFQEKMEDRRSYKGSN